MVHQIIFKKRFQNKLEKLLIFLEDEYGLLVAQKFAEQLDKKFLTLLKHPLIGKPSITIPHVRSILAGKYNRLYYKIENDKLIVINMYDTRINPKKNRLK